MIKKRSKTRLAGVLVLFLTLSLLLVYACTGTGGQSDKNGSKDSTKEDAPSNIKSAYDLDPNNSRFRMLLGKYYVMTNQFEKAIEDDKSTKANWDDGFTYILRRERTNMEAAVALADAYIRWGDYLKNRNPEKVTEKYQHAALIIEEQMELNENHAKLMFEMCRIHIRLGNEKQFFQTYMEATDKDPGVGSVEDYTAGEIAEFFIDRQNYGRAKDILVKMSRRGSREPKVHYELSRVNYAQDRLNDAFEDLIRAKDYSDTYNLDPTSHGTIQYASPQLRSMIMNDLGRIKMESNRNLKNEKKIKEFAMYHTLMATKYDMNNGDAFVSLGDMLYSELTQPHKLEKINYAILCYVKAAAIFTKYELSEITSDTIKSVITESINDELFIMQKNKNKIIDQAVKEILNHTGTMENIKASSVFYKIGYLYYEKALMYQEEYENKNYTGGILEDIAYDKIGTGDINKTQLEENKEDIENLLKSKIEEKRKIARNSLFIAFSKGDASLRHNPNLNFALGNSYYYEEEYELAINQYENIISYLNSHLSTKYMTKSNLDKEKSRIHLELSWAYNNMGAARYLMFKETGDTKYFKEARTNFLMAQDYYVKSERNINSPKTGNLRDLFDKEKMNLPGYKDSAYQPSIYENININLLDIIM